MKRSFIIYTNNSEKYIGRLLHSIVDQLDDEHEQIVIVDDLSTDQTVNIIINELGYLLTDEEHYKFYINRPVKGKRKSIEMGKKIASGDFKFIVNKKKPFKVGG